MPLCTTRITKDQRDQTNPHIQHLHLDIYHSLKCIAYVTKSMCSSIAAVTFYSLRWETRVTRICALASDRQQQCLISGSAAATSTVLLSHCVHVETMQV